MELFGDYALVVNDELKIGSIVRILLKGKFGAKDYKLPVQYDHENKANLTVTVAMYEVIENNDSFVQLKSSGETQVLKFCKVFSHVNLTYEEGCYVIPAAEYRVLEGQIHAGVECKQRGTRKQKQVSSKTVVSNSTSTVNDGFITELVSPLVSEDGHRRSKRTRTVKTSVSSVLI